MASFPVNIKSCQNKAAMTMAATRSSEPSLRHNYPFSVRCRLLPLNCISSETNIRKITCLPLRGQSEGHFERHLTKSVWTEKTEQTQQTALNTERCMVNSRQLPSCSGCIQLVENGHMDANRHDSYSGILTYYEEHTNHSADPQSSGTLHMSRTAHMTRWELG